MKFKTVIETANNWQSMCKKSKKKCYMNKHK